MSNLSNMKSMAQARAKFAWDCANKADDGHKKGNKGNQEYASIVRKIPAYIKTNGLLNTLAFLYSKKNSAKNGEALQNIRVWLVDSSKNPFCLISEPLDNEEQLLDYLLDKQKSDTRFLMQCTLEVLALFNWLRRFVESK